ncbi:MAG TPA: EI24 domain-containing protein, partial [Paracoccaceae bacterium]|nr:EI24 domain-containing protein [Paracoccaceae bacterium]
MIISDFMKALGQIADPQFRRVLWIGLGLTVALLFGTFALFLTAIQVLLPDTLTLPLIGEVQWVNELASGATFVLLLVLSIFLMVPVASAFTGLFLEDVAKAVEDRHYPSLPPAPRIPFREVVQDTIGFFAVLVGANIAALLLYVLFPPAAPFIFWGVNGLLLGREYFQLVAMRRLGRSGAKAMRARHSGQIWLAGVLMAVPLSVPLLNLIVPILGAATFTHLFHRLS